ncbi:FCD domain-containing protein [Acidimangrovimonas sediminis]|uniref:FCD domain-containing protein n=1 Tax=Acidimangrovimonas sediminis TaxID=2056283 RepID=UPI000C8036EA|nr:FCD domain-containing protein [Acidimangrovimonas sediminis]
MSDPDRRAWIEMYKATGNTGKVCAHFGISRQTLRKWVRRYEEQGTAGLTEPSRRPRTSPNRKVFAREEALILALRRERRLGAQKIRAELARQGISLSTHTILKVLRRAGEPALAGRAPLTPPRAAAPAALAPRNGTAAMPAPESDAVAETLRTMIVGGQVAPGAKLNESELSRRLNVGRAVVRAALQSLAPDGLVVFQKNRGAFVNNPSIREIQQAYAARRLIERAIVTDICAHCTAHDVRVLRRHVEKQRAADRAGDRGALVGLLTDFHTLIASLGENRALEGFVRGLAMKTSLAVLLFDHVGSSCAIEEHAHLIDLIAAGESEAACTLLDAHLGSSLDRLEGETQPIA